MKKIVTAFCPGDYILEELEERGRTQKEFAELLGITRNEVNDLIKGRRSITARIALRISKAFGTSAEVWLNLQVAYDLDLLYNNNKEIEQAEKVSNRVSILSFA